MPLDSTPTLETQSFEQAMAALEQIVMQLETGQLSLDEAVDLFEQGVRLAKSCGDRLDSAKLRISRLEEVLGMPVIDQ